MSPRDNPYPPDSLEALAWEVDALRAEARFQTTILNSVRTDRARLMDENIDLRAAALALLDRLERAEGLGEEHHRIDARDGRGWLWADLTPWRAVPEIERLRAALEDTLASLVEGSEP